MYHFNDRAAGIFADGYQDRAGVPVGDTFVYMLRAKLIGAAGQDYTIEQNREFAKRFYSAEMDAMMVDPSAPHVRVEYDPEYPTGKCSVAYVPKKLVDVHLGLVEPAFALRFGVSSRHIVSYDLATSFDEKGVQLRNTPEDLTDNENQRLGHQITDEDFAALAWPAQSRVLRELNNLSCAQEGRTYGEAQRKRAPIDKRMQELQAIHDKQCRDWISAAGNSSPPAEPGAFGELDQMHDDAVNDEPTDDAPGMR